MKINFFHSIQFKQNLIYLNLFFLRLAFFLQMDNRFTSLEELLTALRLDASTIHLYRDLVDSHHTFLEKTLQSFIEDNVSVSIEEVKAFLRHNSCSAHRAYLERSVNEHN